MNIIEKTFSTKGNMDTREKTQRIILHHADSSNCTVEDIDRWHKNNGWCKIGYHFFIRKDGTIYRGREENAVGAHAYGSNYNSLGICFEGRYEQEEMTQEQIKSGQELIKFLKEKYGITTVQKHKDVNRTSCPGKNFQFDKVVNGKVEETAKDNTNKESTTIVGEITNIQKTLNERYALNIKVDNIYGNETKGALVFGLQRELNTQFKKGLAEDKIFGPKTKEACINVKEGANGNITWLIQANLVCHGFDLKVDSIFGTNTTNIVKEFQRRNGLTVDGICGKNTFNALFK